MRLLFGNYAIDAARRELWHGAEAVQVEPQVFDLLLYLIRNRDRVVSKDELLSTIWHGRIVSESTLSSRINAARHAIGDSGEQQSLIRTIARRGIRFVGAVREESSEPSEVDSASVLPEVTPPRTISDRILSQTVTFCRTVDGVHLAVATVGDGPPVVKTANWLNHIEHDWKSPVWSPLIARLAAQFRLIRYDERGCGLSDWDVADFSLEAFVRDLEAVVDTLGLTRFALLGVSQGAAVAVAYATRHRERVSRLVLCGGYAMGWRKRGNATEIAQYEALITLIRHGWGQDNPAFRQVFTSRYVPGATLEQMNWFNDLQRESASPENAIRLARVLGDIDVSDLLSQVAAPTLVLHSRDDAAVPFEQGLMLAHGIPKARFVALDSRNHLPLSHEPAWQRFTDEVSDFLNENSGDSGPLAAAGLRQSGPLV